MRSLEVNATQLFYDDAGLGDPAIFIHGSLGDLRSWRHQMAPFAEQYHVIAYSRRYHYPNVWDGDGSDYSAELHATDLAAFIRVLSVAPAHLVTSSRRCLDFWGSIDRVHSERT